MQQYTKQFDFSNVKINNNENMTFQTEWMNDEQKMMEYICWIWKHVDPKLNREQLIHKHCNLRDEIEDLAIQTNNLMVLEMLWQSVYFHDRATPVYWYPLIESSKYSNFDTFIHCLYVYMNGGSEPDDVAYSRLLSSKNQEIVNFVKKLEPIVDENRYLPCGYSDNIDISNPSEEEEEWFEKIALYRKIIKDHFTPEGKFAGKKK